MNKFRFLVLSVLCGSSLFADGAASAPSQPKSNWIVMVVLAVAFFYLILFRPEQKRRKRMEQMRRELVKGSRITAMGILGTVERLEEKTVVLKTIDGSQIEILREVITKVEPALSTPLGRES